MKKFFSVSATVCCMMFSSVLSAQVDMVWDTHGVGFKVPRGFVIKTNNQNEFSASNDDIWLTIAPVQDENVTEDDLADAVVEMAKEMDYDLVTDADKLEIDDFVGYYVRGTKNGVTALVMALLDTESSTNLLVVIGYNDDSEDAALMIANSFYAYD
jgi:hypothetical protein